MNEWKNERNIRGNNDLNNENIMASKTAKFKFKFKEKERKNMIMAYE